MLSAITHRGEPALAPQQPTSPAMRRTAAPRPSGPAMPPRTPVAANGAAAPAAAPAAPEVPKEPAMAQRALRQTLHPQPVEQQQRAHASEVATQFEELFVRMMVQDLRKTAQFGGEDDGLFGGGPGSDTYSDWFDQNLAEHISKNGRVGIAAVLMQDFERAHQIPQAPPKQAPMQAALAKGGLDVAG